MTEEQRQELISLFQSIYQRLDRIEEALGIPSYEPQTKETK